MGCKHKDVIAIQSNGQQEFYCKAFKKRISNYDCRNCMMKLEDNNTKNQCDINELFNEIFGKGFNT